MQEAQLRNVWTHPPVRPPSLSAGVSLLGPSGAKPFHCPARGLGCSAAQHMFEFKAGERFTARARRCSWLEAEVDSDASQ